MVYLPNRSNLSSRSVAAFQSVSVSSVSTPINTSHVAGPTIPSESNPFWDWNFITANLVAPPNIPSAGNPNASWISLTFDPLDPFFNNIFTFF